MVFPHWHHRNDQWAKVLNATCLAEDPNNNGIKESGEPGAESNGNSTFEPNGSALVRPSSGTGSSLVTVTTDSTGSAEFLLEYPRNYGSWVTVEIIATAVVAGKEQHFVHRYRVAGTDQRNLRRGHHAAVCDFAIRHGIELFGYPLIADL